MAPPELASAVLIGWGEVVEPLLLTALPPLLLLESLPPLLLLAVLLSGVVLCAVEAEVLDGVLWAALWPSPEPWSAQAGPPRPRVSAIPSALARPTIRPIRLTRVATCVMRVPRWTVWFGPGTASENPRLDRPMGDRTDQDPGLLDYTLTRKLLHRQLFSYFYLS